MEYDETLLVLTKKSFILLVSSAKMNHLEYLKNGAENRERNIVFIVKDKANNTENFKKIYDMIKSDSEKISNPVLGNLPREKQIGALASEWDKWVVTQDASFKDVGSFIPEVLSKKDNDELDIIKKCGSLTTFFQKKLIEDVELFIDEDKKVKHSDISRNIEGLLDQGVQMNLLEKNFGVDRNYVDLAYAPIIQSGGKYDLKPTAESDSNYLKYDVILCSVAAKYHGYSVNVVRSLFIEPLPEQKQTYQTVVHAQDMLIQSLKKGVHIKEVYNKVFDFIKSKDASLVEKLLPNFGFGIGLEFKENHLSITARNERVIENGMVFNAFIAVNNLSNSKGQPYAIMLADTVVVRDDHNEILTKSVQRRFDDISYSLTEEPPEPKVNTKQPGKPTRAPSNPILDERELGRRKLRSATVRRTDDDEKRRKEHQAQLLRQKEEEMLERLHNGTLITSKRDHKMTLDNLTAYKSPEDLPKTLKRNQIQIDAKNASILVPIFGQLVPLHVSVIKNVTKSDEGKIATVRINLNVPGGPSTLSNLRFPEIKNGNSVYIRELTFKSHNGAAMTAFVKNFKDLQKNVKQLMQERQDNEDAQEQDNIVLIKGPKPILPDILIRPVLSGKKTFGSLECHQNGLRFSTKKGEKVDIIFNNIKYAFHQPGEGDQMAILHFNLKHPILVGKKKTSDIQFYNEMGVVAEDIDFRRKPMNDYDEIEQEDRERESQRKLNAQFLNFAKQVENISKNNCVFDIPYKEIGFYGSPYRSNIFLQPTQSCLINLRETPYFILPIDEIEVAHFERVSFRLKNFDLSFVFRDYNKPVIRINAVPTEYMETIKNWLDGVGILFFEGSKNINWSELLANIRKKPETFVKDGGWKMLQENNDGEEDEEDEIPEGDSEFTVSEVDEDEESEGEFSDEDDEEGEADNDDDGDFDAEDDDDDLDELVDEEDEEESDRPRNKKKPGAAGGNPRKKEIRK